MKNTEKNTGNNITVALAQIRQRVADAEQRFNRNSGSIQLLTVSKTKPVADIQAAIDAGQSCFAENYLQEAIEKITRLDNAHVNWHFIGPIQSNKHLVLHNISSGYIP